MAFIASMVEFRASDRRILPSRPGMKAIAGGMNAIHGQIRWFQN
jgi:hypothetical protein